MYGPHLCLDEALGVEITGCCFFFKFEFHPPLGAVHRGVRGEGAEVEGGE